jgi:insulysin
MKVFVISKQFESKVDKKEKWYGTEYREDAIDSRLLQNLKTCGTNEAFRLPTKNEFIPEQLALVKNECVKKYPYVIKNTSLMRVWFKEDDKFLLPKASVRIEIRNPITTQDPKYSNMTSLFIELLVDSLNEYSYAADLAGLRYNVSKTNYGIQVRSFVLCF